MASSNTKQAFWVSIGSMIALIFTMASAMVMSRCYTVDEYGTYKQIFWIYSSLTIVFTLGLPKTFGYFLPKVPLTQGKNLTTKITRIFYILGFIFSVLLFSLSSTIASILENPELAIGLKYFSPIPFFLLPTMGIESIYATYKKTEISSLYNIISRGSIAAALITAAILYKHSYIYAIIAFNLASIINFWLAMYLKNKPFIGIQKEKTAITYREIFAFSIPLMAANIVNIIINSTDQFFISRYLGVDKFAEYSNGAMELPFIGMIVGSCSVVLLPVYTRLRHQENKQCAKEETLNLWRTVISKTVLLIYPIIVFCMFFPEEIMVLLYGDKYALSGPIFFIMLFNNFFSVVSSYPLILALDKVRQYFKIYVFDCILLIVLESLIVVFCPNIYLICIASVFALILRNILFIRIIAKELAVSLSNLIPLKTILTVILSSTIILFITRYAIKYLDLDNLFTILIAGLAYILLYLVASKILRLDYFSIIKPLLKR